MSSRLQLAIAILALLISFLSGLSARAQDERQRHVYSVKYVCGNNQFGLNQTAATMAAGGYSTDINIQRAQNSSKATISVQPSPARSLFAAPGARTGRVYSTVLNGSEVVGIICQDIGQLLDRPGFPDNRFRMGFLQIFSFEPLSVVVVYTAKHCRTLVGASYLRNQVCDGDVALDVVRYDPVLIEPVEKVDF